MTVYRRGEVVLVEFVFSDELGSKLRPALVISSSAVIMSTPFPKPLRIHEQTLRCPDAGAS